MLGLEAWLVSLSWWSISGLRGCETTSEVPWYVCSRVETSNLPGQIGDFLYAITNSQLLNEQTFSYMKLGLYLLFQLTELKDFFPCLLSFYWLYL